MVLTRSRAEQAESRRGLFISRLESEAERYTPRRSRRTTTSRAGDGPQLGPAASAAAATAAGAAVAAAAVPRRRSGRFVLVALLFTLGLQLVMRGLLGAPPEPVDVSGPTARSRLLWLPLSKRLATPLYSAYPKEALSNLRGWLGSLTHSLPSVRGDDRLGNWQHSLRRGWHSGQMGSWLAGWRGSGPVTLAPLCANPEGQPAPSWMQQQATASVRLDQLQQELAACSSNVHNARQQHAAAADEAQRCQRQLKKVAADAVKCQGELLAALDGQAEEAAASEAAIEQAQAAQAAGRKVQKQLAMVESRAALLAQQLQEATQARKRAEAAGRAAETSAATCSKSLQVQQAQIETTKRQLHDAKAASGKSATQPASGCTCPLPATSTPPAVEPQLASRQDSGSGASGAVTTSGEAEHIWGLPGLRTLTTVMVWASVLAVGTASVAILRSERMLARLQRQSEQAEAAAAAARLAAVTSPLRHASAAMGSAHGSRDSQSSCSTTGRPSLLHWAAQPVVATSAAGAPSNEAGSSLCESLPPSVNALFERADAVPAACARPGAVPPHPAAVAAAAVSTAAGTVSTLPTPQLRQPPGAEAPAAIVTPASTGAAEGCSPRPPPATRRSLRYSSSRTPSAHAASAWAKHGTPVETAVGLSSADELGLSRSVEEEEEEEEEEQQQQQQDEEHPELLRNPLFRAAVARHSTSPESLAPASLDSSRNPVFECGSGSVGGERHSQASGAARGPAAGAKAGLPAGPSDNPLLGALRGSNADTEAYVLSRAAAAEVSRLSVNPLFSATVSAEAEVEAAVAPLLVEGEAAAQQALSDPHLARFAAAEAAAAEHAAAAVQLRVRLLTRELALLQRQLANQTAAAAEAQTAAQAAAAASAEQRAARQAEQESAQSALAGMRVQLEAATARLAASQSALVEAREEAAAARREASALGVQLEQRQLLSALDASFGRRQVSMLTRLLSCRATEAEQLLGALQSEGRDGSLRASLTGSPEAASSARSCPYSPYSASPVVGLGLPRAAAAASPEPPVAED